MTDRSASREPNRESRKTTGVVFDVQEFAVNDGPGLRMTVFL